MYFKNNESVEEQKKKAMERLGKRLKVVRNSDNTTQQQLIDYLGIKGGKSLISQTEHGKRTLPASVLPVLADRYKTNVETFFLEEGEEIQRINLIYELVKGLSDEDTAIAHKRMSRIEPLFYQAKENIGDSRLFDVIYLVLKIYSTYSDDKGFLYEQLDVLKHFDYKDGQSKFMKYIDEGNNNHNYL